MGRIIKEWAVVVDGKVKMCAVADRDFFDLPASCDGSVKSRLGDSFDLIDLSEYEGQKPAEDWNWDGTTFSCEFQTVATEEEAPQTEE